MYLGRYEEAERGFQELIGLNPNHRNGTSMLSRIEMQRGNVDSALAFSEPVKLRRR